MEELTHEELAEDLARWAGEEAAAAQRDACERDKCDCGNCVDRARADAEHDMHAFVLVMPIDKARARHAKEFEERAVARARREGVPRPA